MDSKFGMSETTNPSTSLNHSDGLNLSLTYEQGLEKDLRWAMDEGSRHFEEKSAVHETLRRICQRLNEMQIPYAVVGGMALFKHGYRRFTEDVDILVTRKSLTKIHEELDGLGYRPPFTGSKHLRDAEHKVKIVFLVTGEYPGDGKPKDVAFPDPSDVADEENGIRYLNLNTLIELKIASGMTGQDRMKDLVDVQELIKVLSLQETFAENLSPYVQPKFNELWKAARSGTRRYMTLWRNKFLTTDATNFDEVIEKLTDAVELLKQMRADGVEVDPDGGTTDDYLHLVTTDPEIAKKFDMHDEREFWGEGQGDSSDESKK
ncbi:nucleotidyltransferase family protein [bacterium]|nr:nucleotidyltransferase family protein [bacterium]